MVSALVAPVSLEQFLGKHRNGRSDILERGFYAGPRQRIRRRITRIFVLENNEGTQNNDVVFRLLFLLGKTDRWQGRK